MLGFFLLLPCILFGQNQKIADSLVSIYEAGSYKPADRLEILQNIIHSQTDQEKMLDYCAEMLEVALELDSTKYIFCAYLETGTAYREKGDFSEALANHFKAREIAVENSLNTDLGRVNIAIADVYSAMNNHSNSVDFYQNGIKILREENDSIKLATAQFNLGDEYFNYGELDSALFFYEESGKIFNALQDSLSIAYYLGNMGKIYAEKGKSDIAERDIKKAIQILDEFEDYYGISDYLITLSDIYFEKGDADSALNYAKRSLDLAQQNGQKAQIMDANLKLSELYEKMGNLVEYVKYYKEYEAYDDSVSSKEAMQEIADLRTEYEVSQKQAEVDLLVKESEIAELKDKRQNFIIYASILLLIMVALLALNGYRRHRYVQKTKKLIEIEKNKSEDLLLNILPRETAQELRDHGSVKARKIESATVLFTDFVEFSKLAENEEPELIVRSIDDYFKKFDEITTRYKLEKIKTIGDSYMCAGGLHSQSSSQAREVVLAAREMITIVNKEMDSTNELIHFDIRIGIHTGPVVAGIVGTKKWQFDIWGDTVNIASRMESNSEKGRINISETTHNEIKDEFAGEYRGEVDVKNHGRMRMYFVA